MVYVGSIVPAGAQVLRAAREAGIETTFATNVAVNGATVREVAGNVSNFYTLSHRCLPSYCDGAADRVIEISDRYQERWGEQMDESYAIVPYDLGTAISEAIDAAGTTDSAEVAAELFSGDLVVDTVIAPGKKAFSEECHRPQPAAFDIELWTNGQAKKVAESTVGDPRPRRREHLPQRPAASRIGPTRDEGWRLDSRNSMAVDGSGPQKSALLAEDLRVYFEGFGPSTASISSSGRADRRPDRPQRRGQDDAPERDLGLRP